MELIYTRNGHKGSAICGLFAGLYYVGVRIFADENYHTEAPLWCNNSCARNLDIFFTSEE